MKKIYFIILSCLIAATALSQVGINTTNPNAQLDVRASNQAVPTNTDGMLIPKIDVFPAINPTIAQQGMLVYLTTTVGVNVPGFYYWNNTPASWLPLKGINGGTLDQAYDFGGAGLGKTITADAGAVLINGTDGFVSTGTLNSGAIAPSGAGVKMFWNPRKAAFRAGSINGTQWDDTNVGTYSSAFGLNTNAIGGASTTFGQNSTASGNISTAFGSNSSARGSYSTAMGEKNIAQSYGETVIGIGATNYTPLSTTNNFIDIRAQDRLFVIGNANDVNGTNNLDEAERSDAMVVLKGGSTGIGVSNPEGILDISSSNKGILIPRIALTTAIIQAPVSNPQGGNISTSTLIYNTATNGVSPNNVYPGFYYWNGTKWIRFDTNGENNPKHYTVVGTTNANSPPSGGLTLMPEMEITLTPNDNVVLVNFSAAGFSASANCGQFGLFFQIVLDGVAVKGWQTSLENISNVADKPIWDTTISYPINVTPGISHKIQILWYLPGCINAAINLIENPLAVGVGANYQAHRSLTIIDPNGGGGIVGSAAVTTNMWSQNGNAGTNASSNFVGTVDPQPLVFKSNNFEGFRIATNGNLGLGTITPLDKLHIVGNIRMVDGNQGLGKIMTSDFNGKATWQDATANAWGLNGNSGTNPTNNFIGTIDNQSLAFRTNNTERMTVLNTGNVGIGTSTPARKFQVSDNSATTTNGQIYIEQSGTGDALMHIGNTGARHFNIGLDTSADSFKIGTSPTLATAVTTGTLMTLLPTGEVGIGTTTPLEKLHVSGAAGLTAIRIANTSTIGATSNVGLDFFRNTAVNTDWRIYNIGANLTIGNSGDDLATVNDLYQFQAGRFMPMNDASQNLGQIGNRWNTVFASNGTINTSDIRQKKNIQNLNYGLSDLMKLRPVSFEWKKDDGSGTKLGLIAQELQQVIPEVVRNWDWEEDEQGNRKKVEASIMGVFYSDLIPVLIKATQEQQVIIEKQKEENKVLKHQLESQSKIIETILNRLQILENK